MCVWRLYGFPNHFFFGPASVGCEEPEIQRDGAKKKKAEEIEVVSVTTKCRTMKRIIYGGQCIYSFNSIEQKCLSIQLELTRNMQWMRMKCEHECDCDKSYIHHITHRQLIFWSVPFKTKRRRAMHIYGIFVLGNYTSVRLRGLNGKNAFNQVIAQSSIGWIVYQT